MSLDIPSLLTDRAKANPSGAAIVSDRGCATSSKELEQRVSDLTSLLRDAGVTREDRIAVALPDGPSSASMILATMCVAICAPIDCDVPLPQLATALIVIGARAVIVEPSLAEDLSSAIDQPDLMVLTLETETGMLRVDRSGTLRCRAKEPGSWTPDIPALILHTSGTTSRPKGVLLSHRSICLSAQSMARTLAVGSEDRCLAQMPLFHVHGLVGTLLAPLVSGGASIQPGRFYAACFLEQLADTGATWFSASPAILHQVNARAAAAIASEAMPQTQLKFIRSASAPLSMELLGELERQFGVPVIEAYGMTEASHQVTTCPLPPKTRKPGSVGRPDIVEVAILRPDGSRAPVGVEGEVIISGPTVITAYDVPPEAKSASFHDGWLRTGDLGHLDADGDLFLGGRLKEVINRGGEKISPGEVEKIIVSHPAIAEAGVFALPDERLGEEVAVCVVNVQGKTVGARELQDFASRQIAGYKVPRFLFFAESLPKSSTGKLQRHLLRGLEEVKAGLSEESGKDQVDAEETNSTIMAQLVSIWEEVLGLKDIGLNDDYFALGGDSLQAVMILARIRTTFGADLPASALFDRPTVARLGREIETAQTEAGEMDAKSLRRQNFPDSIRPLSFTQELILEVSGSPLVAESSAFNRIGTIRMQGDLDRTALKIAIAGIVETHEVLRSVLAFRDGTPVVSVREPEMPVIEELGQSNPQSLQSRDRLKNPAIAFGNRPYALERDSLLRFGLLHLGTAEHLLVVGAHYFVFDGWSMDIFVRELAERYAAAKEDRVSAIEPPDVGYGDYAEWQSELRASGAIDAKLKFWNRLLSGELPRVKFDRKRWTSPENAFELRRRLLSIPEQTVKPLRRLAALNRATLNMVLLAALKILYGTLEGQRDNVILIQSAGRSEKATERLIGNFVQTLPIRSQLEPDQSFLEVLASVRLQCLEAVANETVPFAQTIREMFPDRDLLIDPISPLLFVFKNFPMRAATGGGVGFSVADLEYQSEVFGLIVKVHEGRGALDCNFLYNPIVVSPNEADILARCYGALLDRIASDPEMIIGALLPKRVVVRAVGLHTLVREALDKVYRKLRNATC